MTNNNPLTQSTSELQGEDDPQTPDGILIDSDFVVLPKAREPNLMDNLHSDEELSDERISQLIHQFTDEFNDRYPSSGLTLFIGPLDQALTKSLYNSEDTQPLILFLYHGLSVYTYSFCAKVLCSNDIMNYIGENFLVWAWDRTHKNNYQQLLKMIQKNFHNQINDTIVSLSSENFPMLICLSYDDGNVNITKIIQGCLSHDDTFESLKEARHLFDARIETPHSTISHQPLITNEVWSMSSSTLQPIENLSEEFERIANTYARQKEHVVEINKIENSSWSSQYHNQIAVIRKLRPNDSIEKILVYPCPQVWAQHILQYGFNNDQKMRTFGHGLYFQLPSTYQTNYLSSTSIDDRSNALLVCHVVVGRTCHKDDIIKMNPRSYDSITDGSGTYVINGNQNILPIYYIKY